MKRYMIFLGDYCYPAGGMRDYKGCTEDLVEAVSKVEEIFKSKAIFGVSIEEIKRVSWAHIWDNKMAKIIWTHGG